jgi:hypothetical protein
MKFNIKELKKEIKELKTTISLLMYHHNHINEVLSNINLSNKRGQNAK